MTEHVINERFLKIGKIPYPHALQIDQSVSLKFMGDENYQTFEVVKIETKSNQDGSVDEVYILKHSP